MKFLGQKLTSVFPFESDLEFSGESEQGSKTTVRCPCWEQTELSFVFSGYSV